LFKKTEFTAGKKFLRCLQTHFTPVYAGRDEMLKILPHLMISLFSNASLHWWNINAIICKLIFQEVV